MGNQFSSDSGIEKGIGILLVVTAVLGLIAMSTMGLGSLQRSAERAAATAPPASNAAQQSDFGVK